MRSANQLLIIDSKHGKGESNQKPLKLVLHKNKTAHNVLSNDSTILYVMDNKVIENNVIDEEE